MLGHRRLALTTTPIGIPLDDPEIVAFEHARFKCLCIQVDDVVACACQVQQPNTPSVILGESSKTPLSLAVYSVLLLVSKNSKFYFVAVHTSSPAPSLFLSPPISLSLSRSWDIATLPQRGTYGRNFRADLP